MLSSHAGDGPAVATLPWHDVDAKLTWRRHCRGNLAAARCRCLVMLVIMLPSHAGDGTAGVTCLQHSVDAKSCWGQWCWVMLAMALQLKVVLAIVRLHSPRDEHRGAVASWRWIFVLPCSQVIAGKYHNQGTSPYGKNLTLLSVSNKGFAHRLARTWCLHYLLDSDIRSHHSYES
jgi:hypothetical protein